MNELFGISMNTIMYVLLGCLAVALSTVVIVALRNRVMFKIGVRNIPRRPAQTILIIVGLMLSTLIISAAFTTGDTVSRSITSQVYRLLGSVDETIVLRSNLAAESIENEDENSIIRDPSFDAAAVSGMIAQLERDPLIDAVVPTFSDVAAAINPDKRLSARIFTVQGLDPARSNNLDELKTVSGGNQVRVSDLAPGEIYLNKSAAEELNARAGDRITVRAFDKEVSFRVKDVIEDSRLGGSGGISVQREGGIVPLAAAQELFNAPGKLTMIAISNVGDARGGVKHSDEVTARAREIAETQSVPLSVLKVKQISVGFADEGASLFTTFFLVLGLFSIGAGILLIFLIFVMLAAERKSEMGMARAVGTKRADLVQTFLAEGMTYNILAAMVGTALGVGVAVIIARVMASIFANFDIDISPHVTLRSLPISYSLGVVLTFFTVTFSSWRVSNINIVRAIRDIPDPPPEKPDWRGRGFFGTILSLIFKRGSKKAWAARIVIFVVALFMLMSAGAPSSEVVQALLGTFGGLLFIVFIFLTFQFGPLFIAAGIPLVILGASGHDAFPLLFGLSLIPLGLALLIRSFGANERLVYTTAGLVMLYIWLADFQFKLLEKIFGEVTGDIEMFFLSGVMITLAATFVIVYNADVVLGALMRLGRGFGALMPSLKMAVAYPLSNRVRTGMTMAMFCLVVFSLIVMSTMNHNFNHVFISDRALGGWDIIVDENPTNQIPDLNAALRQTAPSTADKIEGVGLAYIANDDRARLCQITPDEKCETANAADLGDFTAYQVRGEDPSFLRLSDIAMQTRARGYDSDEAIWAAIASDPSLAVVDANAVSGGFAIAPISGVAADARQMDPVQIVVYDRQSQQSRPLTVIGVIELGFSNTYFGLHTSSQSFNQVFAQPDFRRYYVQTKPGTNNRETAREIESALLNTGAEAQSLRDWVDEQASVFGGFFRLLQGFMGLGLFVGVAAVGVIAFRTVVERRQQIGMLRALGYTRGMVGLTFMLESGFIAFAGIASGIVFGLILARFLILDEFANQGVVEFVIPYGQVAIIGGLAFGSALLMTLVPSRQAASIPIAEALRYE